MHTCAGPPLPSCCLGVAQSPTPSGTLTQLGTHPPFRFPLKEQQPLALWLSEGEVSGRGHFLDHLGSPPPPQLL